MIAVRYSYLRRAHMAARGETVEWANHQVDPRYSALVSQILQV
jgi:hypothetical protein